MGMLMDGQWSATDDKVVVAGAYRREQSTFDNAIADEVIHRMAGHSRRYILVASMSCPWSHRVLLVRAIKGLEDRIPMHVAGGNRIEGYGMHPAGPLRLDGATPLHVHQLYTESHPGFTGRVTVPLLWDDSNSLIVSNDSALIMRALDRID
ncbi:MAG: glutathione-dependent reductase, partial [Granulosicoccus sp.]|nr:glutathione-dependent reductase [Granulosicoccus sp.]